MKIFVLGASGYIGSAVAEAFARAGHEVSGLVRRPEAGKALQRIEVRPVFGKLQEPGSFLPEVEVSSAVVYAVADYQGGDPLAVDRAALEAILAVEGGSRPRTVLYTSGVWVHGDTGAGLVDETSPLKPARAVKGRPEIERMVLESSRARGLVIRPGCVYGGRGGLTGMWFEGVEKGEVRVIGEGRNRWAMVHLEDLAEVYLRLIESGLSREVFDVTDRSRETVNEMVEAVVAAGGGRARISHLPTADAEKQMGPLAECLAMNQHVDGRKAVRLLGWQPRHGGFVDGVKSCYEAWKAWRPAV